MLKLSELPNNTMLCVSSNHSGDIQVMDKADFLDSSYFLDYPVEPFPKVTLAVPVAATFDLRYIIECIGEDEMYEDWDDYVYDCLKDEPETKAFLDLVKKTFKAHPTYYEGRSVEIDMTPK